MVLLAGIGAGAGGGSSDSAGSGAGAGAGFGAGSAGGTGVRSWTAATTTTNCSPLSRIVVFAVPVLARHHCCRRTCCNYDYWCFCYCWDWQSGPGCLPSQSPVANPVVVRHHNCHCSEAAACCCCYWYHVCWSPATTFAAAAVPATAAVPVPELLLVRAHSPPSLAIVCRRTPPHTLPARRSNAAGRGDPNRDYR